MDYEEYLPELNKTAQRYFKKIQDLVKYCMYCQPYDGGECIWIMGERTDLESLFEQHAVPDKYRDLISEKLICDNCGRTGFDRYEDIGLEDRFRAELYETVERAENKFGNKLDDFQNHLIKYPSLALSKPLGNKIYKEITSARLVTTEASGEYFRARVLRDSKILEPEDLGAPPIGVSGEGRYHHSGQRVFYVAPEQEHAINEVLEFDISKALVWIQKYYITKAENILDLTVSEENISEYSSPLMIAILPRRILIEEVKDRHSTWKPQYLVTRFIADCARLAGYSGIKYSSTRGHGSNIILFEPDLLDFKPIGRPTVLIYDKNYKDIIDNEVDF